MCQSFVFSAAMLDGNPSEEKTLHVRSGGNIVVECSFARGSRQKYFCRENCQAGDILATTSGARVKRGRYGIEYLQATPEGWFVIVSITGLTPSDSGSYRCGVGSTRYQTYRKFRVSVTDGEFPPGTDVCSRLSGFCWSVAISASLCLYSSQNRQRGNQTHQPERQSRRPPHRRERSPKQQLQVVRS